MVGRVAYRSGFVKRVDDVGSLPAITIEAADLPADVLAFLDQHLLDLGGTYGETPRPASPFRRSGARSYVDCSGGNVRVSCSSGHHRLVARAR